MSKQEDIQIIEESVISKTGEVQIKRYSRGRLLGKGGFASVYEAISLDSKQIQAVKIMDKNSITKPRARQKLMTEVKIHKSLSHPNIVKFDHFFEDENFIYIFLELCTNQSLSDLMRRRKRLAELETQCYLFQLLLSLKYLHSHRVIHRDIKLGNLFLNDKMELKMGDFGLAAKLEYDGERKRTICGTPNYIAPEILDGKYGHSYEVDVWSFGVLMYTLLIGKPPFETSDVKTTYRRIRMNAYTFPDHISLTSEAKNLIERILVTDPALRIPLSDIEQHPFFVKNIIPKFLPTSSLAIPLTASFIRQFEKKPSLAAINSKRNTPNGRLRSASHKEIGGSPRLKEENQRSKERALSGEKNSSPSGSGSNTKKIAVTSLYVLAQNGPRIWVKKWADYSNKYGIGYVLSNGCAGVYFNDNTKIVSDKEGDFFQYLFKSDQASEEELSEYQFSNFPASLQKKVTLLMHFRKHLTFEDKVDAVENPLSYVKKWLSTKNASIFRLSNKVVQVFFMDRSELLLCSNTKTVIYVNKCNEISCYPISSAMDSNNNEMIKRLKYTKEILTSMLPTAGNNGK